MEKTSKNIILIGFMGSGKTSVGLKLSYKLRRPVEDTDKLIERREGCSVSEIFARRGEAYFREQETKLLEDLVRTGHECIYSVGGGTPVRPCNRPLLRQLGTVVYLRAQPETVYERLKGDTTRPLLQCEDPLGRIRELMESRREAYETCAHLTLEVDRMAPEAIAEAIETYLPGAHG
jgi:shikimate kinase